MIALVIAGSLLIGISLGILGGGGSILTVPILIYLAGMDAKEAIATSLLVVGVTSLAGLVSHARAGRVRWRTGLLFGVAGMTGAYAGGRLAEFIPGTVLLIAFALMMLATAVAMLKGRKKELKSKHEEMPVLHVLVDGVVVGLVTGLVGAGGGFLIVPALALLGGLPMGVAVGTSLLVISMKSFAGLAGYLSSVQIDWGLAGIVTAAAVVGSLVGGRLAGRIPQDTLRKGFGWFVVVMGVFVLGQQVSADIRETVLTSPVTWAAVAVLAAFLIFGIRRRNCAAGTAAGQDGPGCPAERDIAAREDAKAARAAEDAKPGAEGKGPDAGEHGAGAGAAEARRRERQRAGSTGSHRT
ncbi:MULTISPECIES: sulfite exporter TauE/SafE family protein [unclassified Streptomyces]|uniref:sulfite exporter TauE/SafE family protein n=1 Tax=unclassified Streptomyces TaxID=2593676 RepID=UPI0026C6B637|nr:MULTISPECIES: sulfite exporter TauE/SafE family protein [unclassified Streptomyces]